MELTLWEDCRSGGGSSTKFPSAALVALHLVPSIFLNATTHFRACWLPEFVSISGVHRCPIDRETLSDQNWNKFRQPDVKKRGGRVEED